MIFLTFFLSRKHHSYQHSTPMLTFPGPYNITRQSQLFFSMLLTADSTFLSFLSVFHFAPHHISRSYWMSDTLPPNPCLHPRRMLQESEHSLSVSFIHCLPVQVLFPGSPFPMILQGLVQKPKYIRNCTLILHSCYYNPHCPSGNGKQL